MELPVPNLCVGDHGESRRARRHGQARRAGARGAAAGEMPHGGYDRSSSRPAAAFPDFRYPSLADGLNSGGGRAAKGMTHSRPAWPDLFHLKASGATAPQRAIAPRDHRQTVGVARQLSYFGSLNSFSTSSQHLPA